MELKGENFKGIKYAEEGFACLTRDPAVAGFPILGTYQYDDFGTFGPPIVELATSSGKFQKHGVSAQAIEWGILMDPSTNAPVGAQTEFGAKILLFFKLTEPGTTECTPGLICDPNNSMTYTAGVGEWDAADLSISFTDQKMYVLGEREKACETTCQQKAGIPLPP